MGAMLISCDAPEMFCGLRIFTRFSICIGLSFHFRWTYPFRGKWDMNNVTLQSSSYSLSVLPWFNKPPVTVQSVDTTGRKTCTTKNKYFSSTLWSCSMFLMEMFWPVCWFDVVRFDETYFTQSGESSCLSLAAVLFLSYKEMQPMEGEKKKNSICATPKSCGWKIRQRYCRVRHWEETFSQRPPISQT